jgi:GNAT superfamily N-acetyltransferase
LWDEVKQVQIIQPAPQDYQKVHGFFCQKFRETEIKLEPKNESIIDEYMASEFPLDKIKESLEDSNTYWRVLSDDSHWFGVIRMRFGISGFGLPEENIAMLDRAYLSQNYQSKGYGKLLFQEMISLARSLKVKTLWWDVYCRNEKAITIYEKMGAQRVAEDPFEYQRDGETVREHHVVYALEI